VLAQVVHVDVAVGLPRSSPPDAVVCSPGYVERHGIPQSLSELPDHRFAVYRNRRVTQDWTFRTPKGLRSARVAGRFEVDDGAVLRRAVMASA
jgi:DNA-binding transcriptional LysR family regulator